MVDPTTLLFDVVSTVGFYLLLPILLGVVFLVAWREWGQGEPSGFKRSTFWLLLVGGSLGWLGNIPVFYWQGSFMALNYGGALIPITLALYLLYHYLPADDRVPVLCLLLVWVAAIGTTVAGSALHPAWWWLPLVTFGAGVAGVGASVRAFAHPPVRLGLALGVYALLASVTLFTFFTTYVVPAVGIVSPFPTLLLPPFLAGTFSVLLLQETPAAPALAYATATLGGVVGADVLHQPALYAPSEGSILGAIGGAGPLDLVFLAGLLAMGFSLLTLAALRRMRRTRQPAPAPFDGTSPLSRGLEAFRSRRYAEVAPLALEAVREEATATRRLLYFGEATASEPPPPDLEGLPLHPFVAEDEHRLAAMAANPTADRVSAWRALATGIFLVRGLEEAARLRLAGPFERAEAYLLDLLLTVAPFLLLFAFLCRSEHLSGWVAAFNSIPYEAAIYAAAGYPLATFAGCEWALGTTPGKYLLGLEVRTRELGRPGPLEAVGRNSTKVAATTVLAFALAIGVPLGLSNGSWGIAYAVTVGLAGIGAVLTLGWLGVIVMSTNPRRCRTGDLIAGTMVLTRVVPRRARGLAPTVHPVLSGTG